MILDVHKKFKQSVKYYFTISGIKTQELVVCIKDVIKPVQSTELNIISIICD